MDRREVREDDSSSRQELLLSRGAVSASLPIVRGEGVHCPICLLSTGRRIRGKIYCGNCGYIDS
jgi:hypothetical protein